MGVQQSPRRTGSKGHAGWEDTWHTGSSEAGQGNAMQGRNLESTEAAAAVAQVQIRMELGLSAKHRCLHTEARRRLWGQQGRGWSWQQRGSVETTMGQQRKRRS